MEHTYNLHMPAPALRHSEIPQILLGYVHEVSLGLELKNRYLQVLVNVSVVLFVIYLAAQFVLAVRRDVKDRMAEYSVGERATDEQKRSDAHCVQKSCTRSPNVPISTSPTDVTRSIAFQQCQCLLTAQTHEQGSPV